MWQRIYFVLLSIVESDKRNRTVLMQASSCGQLEMLHYLLSEKDSLNLSIHQTDCEGRNALFYGTECGDVDVVSALIKNDIKPQPDEKNRTVISTACSAGKRDIVELYLNNRNALQIDLDARDEDGNDALFFAYNSSSCEIIKLLLSSQILLRNNRKGESVLAQSLADGNDSIASLILSCDSNLAEVVNGRDKNKGRTVTQHAVYRGDFPLLEQVAKYYDPSFDRDNEGNTSLILAVKSPRYCLEIVKFLIEDINVDPSAVDSYKRSALFYAVEKGCLELMEYLLDKTIIQNDADGKCLLTVCIQSGRLAAFDQLIYLKSFDATNRDKNGMTLLHHAALHGRHFMMQQLLGSVDIDSIDCTGRTPLMLACLGGHYPSVCYLLKLGADYELSDNQGDTALHYCFYQPLKVNVKCIKGLQLYGAEANRQNKRGLTPLMLACSGCSQTNINAIKTLLENGADCTIQDSEGNDAFDACPLGADYVKGMMIEYAKLLPNEIEALEESRCDLYEQLDCNAALRDLIKLKIFTKTLQFEVMKQPANFRVYKLIDILQYRGPRGFRSFCCVLKQQGLYEIGFNLQKRSYLNGKTVEIYV